MRNDKNDDWVSASQIGQAGYCAYQLYLQNSGVEVDNNTKARLHAGSVQHRHFDTAASKKRTSRIKWLLLAVLLMLMIYLLFTL